jgi:hypothetical protein
LPAGRGRPERHHAGHLSSIRACASPRATHFVALTVLANGKTHRTTGGGKGPSVGWTDGRGTGGATLRQCKPRSGERCLELAVEGLPERIVF